MLAKLIHHIYHVLKSNYSAFLIHLCEEKHTPGRAGLVNNAHLGEGVIPHDAQLK